MTRRDEDKKRARAPSLARRRHGERRYLPPVCPSTSAAEIIAPALAGAGRSAGRNTSSPR
ncbi:hypothetical protein BURPSS13_C0137 [Burkholderia pseudomallei S13]|nr:hypothetical protein BURPSS13_C0137 [Burkholderia pseudomallei S13]